MSHLGKVKTEEDKAKNDLRCVAERLAELVDTKVSFCPVTRGEELENMVADLKDGEIVLMQNTRYEKGESKNDPELAQYWASLGEVFVEDAFGSVHRAHVSTVGIPSIIMASIGSVMTFGMNKILIAFTSTATAVFGVYFKLQSFVFMPVFGLNNGTVPIIAYNFGAGRPDRIVKTLKLSIAYAVSIMIAGLLLFNLAAENLLMIFNASDSMLEIGVPALKIISLSYI